jgi:hypothetical protein
MGEVEIHAGENVLQIYAHIITYGNAADELFTDRISKEIELMWNEPGATIRIKDQLLLVKFNISSEWKPELTQMEVVSSTDPRNNFFRIEHKAIGNISFVDGLGCNTGYFLAENLYDGSTTAAHEFGHTLGLDHPADIDLRGKGQPSIMYPRGTLVDPEFQYDPNVPAGLAGGTMHPKFRKVSIDDIRALKIHKLKFNGQTAILGDFTNQFHPDHGHWV